MIGSLKKRAPGSHLWVGNAPSVSTYREIENQLRELVTMRERRRGGRRLDWTACRLTVSNLAESQTPEELKTAKIRWDVLVKNSSRNAGLPEAAHYQVVLLSCITFARWYMAIATARIRCARLLIWVASVLRGSMRRIKSLNSEMKTGWDAFLNGIPIWCQTVWGCWSPSARRIRRGPEWAMWLIRLTIDAANPDHTPPPLAFWLEQRAGVQA